MKWGGPFDPAAEAIWVPAHLFGPEGESILILLVFDTGTPVTTINPEILKAVGFRKKKHARGKARFLGVVENKTCPLYPVPRLTVFGRSVDSLRVAACVLDKDHEVDGILGLDFIRKLVILLDFQNGELAMFDKYRRFLTPAPFNRRSRPARVVRGQA